MGVTGGAWSSIAQSRSPRTVSRSRPRRHWWDWLAVIILFQRIGGWGMTAGAPDQNAVGSAVTTLCGSLSGNRSVHRSSSLEFFHRNWRRTDCRTLNVELECLAVAWLATDRVARARTERMTVLRWRTVVLSLEPSASKVLTSVSRWTRELELGTWKVITSTRKSN